MPHSQGLSNNSYPEQNPHLIPISSRSILILSSHLHLGLPKGLFPVRLLVKILKGLLPSSILATCPANLNLLDLITLTILALTFIYDKILQNEYLIRIRSNGPIMNYHIFEVDIHGVCLIGIVITFNCHKNAPRPQNIFI